MGHVPRYHAALPDRQPGIIRIVAVNGTHRPPDALAPLINVRSGAEADKLTPNVTKFCPTLACTNPHVETVLSYAAARSSRLVPSRYLWRARARTDAASSQQAAPPRLAGAQLYVYMANISVWHTGISVWAPLGPDPFARSWYVDQDGELRAAPVASRVVVRRHAVWCRAVGQSGVDPAV